MQIPGEYLIGFSVLGMGIVTFIGSKSEQAWAEMCMGPWKVYNTPFYRGLSKWGGVCCMALGTAVLTGLIRF